MTMKGVLRMPEAETAERLPQTVPGTPDFILYYRHLLSGMTWAGTPARERDRHNLPVLHHRGTFRVFWGNDPLTPRLPEEEPGSIFFREPPTYFGKHRTPIRAPRATVIDNGVRGAVIFHGFYQNHLNGPLGADMEAARVYWMEYLPQHDGGPVPGFLLHAQPISSVVPDSSIVRYRARRFVAPATFVGGEVLVLAQFRNDYVDTSTPTDVVQPALDNDLTQLALALPRYRRFKMIAYRFNVGAPNDGTMTNVQGQITAALGPSVEFRGPYNTGTNIVAQVVSDIRTYFGL